MSQTTFPPPTSTAPKETPDIQLPTLPETELGWKYQGIAAKRSIRIQARIRKISIGKPVHYEDIPSE